MGPCRIFDICCHSSERKQRDQPVKCPESKAGGIECWVPSTSLLLCPRRTRRARGNFTTVCWDCGSSRTTASHSSWMQTESWCELRKPPTSNQCSSRSSDGRSQG